MVTSGRAGLWVALAGIMASSCGPAPVPKDTLAREEASQVQHVLGLAYPYKIAEWNSYRDRGSTGVLVRDRLGRRVRFFYMVPEPMSRMDTSSVDTLRIPPRYFRLGGDQGMRGARRLSIGGQEELAILDMLDVISLDHFARPTRDSMLVVGQSLVRANNHRAWMKMLEGLSEERMTAMNGALMAVTARSRDPRGMVLWIRGRGWQM